MDYKDRKLTASAEDYLEAALVLNLKGERIKVTSIAAMLDVSKPAATNALNELKDKGLVSKEPYGDITLTCAGKDAAEKVYYRHRLIFDFLSALGVSKEAAENDCCKIEHILSSETVERIKAFMKKTENNK